MTLNQILKTTVLSLLVFTGVAVANGSPSKMLPDSLAGKYIYFFVLGDKTEVDPNAGIAYVMKFKKDQYSYQILDTKNNIQGDQYFYSVSKNQGKEVGIIDLKEVFSKKDTAYRMVLVPENDTTGLYIYQQDHGGIEPNLRLNTGKYTILNL